MVQESVQAVPRLSRIYRDTVCVSGRGQESESSEVVTLLHLLKLGPLSLDVVNEICLKPIIF